MVIARMLLAAAALAGCTNPPNHPVATPCTPQSEHYCSDSSGGCCSDSYPQCAFVDGEPTCNSVDPTPPDAMGVSRPRSVPRNR